jgi:hypothetical protein
MKQFVSLTINPNKQSEIPELLYLYSLFGPTPNK